MGRSPAIRQPDARPVCSDSGVRRRLQVPVPDLRASVAHRHHFRDALSPCDRLRGPHERLDRFRERHRRWQRQLGFLQAFQQAFVKHEIAAPKIVADHTWFRALDGRRLLRLGRGACHDELGQLRLGAPRDRGRLCVAMAMVLGAFPWRVGHAQPEHRRPAAACAGPPRLQRLPVEPSDRDGPPHHVEVARRVVLPPRLLPRRGCHGSLSRSTRSGAGGKGTCVISLLVRHVSFDRQELAPQRWCRHFPRGAVPVADVLGLPRFVLLRHHADDPRLQVRAARGAVRAGELDRPDAAVRCAGPPARAHGLRAVVSAADHHPVRQEASMLCHGHGLQHRRQGPAAVRHVHRREAAPRVPAPRVAEESAADLRR
mmetsp:Transcript_8123/g.20312  ORF Transcript_8123/g.20312 Transcript_8123/m.20312 type:complete len:371 (+) Transcript_8123:562-1674(+)